MWMRIQSQLIGNSLWRPACSGVVLCLCLAIQAQGASSPLTIDLLLTEQAKLTASDAAAQAVFW